MKIRFAITALICSLSFLGCESYLDKSPDASINPEDAYKDFKSFQGFTEELYACIVDPSKIVYTSDFNLADETIMNVTFFLGNRFDAGDYWAWNWAYGSYFGNTENYNHKNPDYLSPNTYYYKGTWYNSWYGIRKANMGLENLNKLVNASQEEKDLIKGQLLFFRGYYYFVIMRDWGGMPYLEKVISPDEKMQYARLNYQETALKAAADLKQAAELLPLNWDDTEAGKRTLGNNRQRINKLMALSFLGKNLLYAASPLMNKESTGNPNYNVELARQAADAFAQVINISSQTGRYSLQPWDSYSDIFYTVSPQRIYPGGSEVIMNPPVYKVGDSKWTCMWGLPNIGFEAQQVGVTANYVKYWGMSNGLPIDDPASGYNPADPWANRDPRFYKTIVVDGDKICNSSNARDDQYAQLYNNSVDSKGNAIKGRHRNTMNNVTGFLSNKYWGLTCNRFDKLWEEGNYQFLPPLMRLSDVYFMYAEAVVQGYGTPQSQVTGCITAEEAVNRVRNRANVPNLNSKFTGSKDAFMEQLIVERAVELSFENMRWNDLRRWLRITDSRYLDKTELLFDRDPVTQKPINMREQLIVKRDASERNNWLPLPADYVKLYSGFYQNPGW